MSFVVLALGAILSLGGAASIYYGAGIVQVEQGWTGVIAGTTALAAGIVTIALGFVLRALDAILATLKSGSAVSLAAPLPVETALAATALPAVAKPEEEAVEPPASLPVAASLAGAVGAAAAWSVAFAAPKTSVLQSTEESLAANDKAAVPLEHVLDETIGAQGHDDATANEPVLVEPPPADVIQPARKSQDEPRSIEDIWRRVDKAFDDEEARPPQPLARAVVPPARPAIEEPPACEAAPVLHDEAFPPFEPPPEDHLPSVPLKRPLEEPLAATTLYEPAPEHELAPQPPSPRSVVAEEPAAANREPTIIGRYEADGVAYVMFADGSIDATSDEGSYHFESMADLRAFIEGKA